MAWRVHGDFTSMLIGGISALMLQMLHPAALAGVWDHSNFRVDMLGRLRRTGQFISGTTFGSSQDANWLIEKVRGIHERVSGVTTTGEPYTASDPQLLTWVHVAEVSSFLAAHLRYKNSQLSPADQDRYYAEIALIAERLGAESVPRSRQEVADYLQAQRVHLQVDIRTRDVLETLLNAPAPSWIAKPFGALVMRAGIGLLPTWAGDALELSQPVWARRLTHHSVKQVAPLLRWAVRNGSSQRAHRRMGLPMP